MFYQYSTTTKNTRLVVVLFVRSEHGLYTTEITS